MATIGAGHSASDACYPDDKAPEEYICEGVWEVEPLYYSAHNSGPLKRGKAYRRVDSGDYVCFEASDSHIYRIGDNVYLDSQQSELPFFVCNITGFKMTKKEQLNAQVKWFYRVTEVPESVYHTLVQDRHTEHSQKETQRDLCIKDTAVKCRELFISDAQDVYPISALRGRCQIKHYKDICEANEFVPTFDAFFYILGYNPENNRLASIQGEIRIGPSHQAKLPALRVDGDVSETEVDHKETLAWSPYRIGDTDLMMFLRAARSMAAFSGMCDGGTTEDGCLAASRDETTINALKTLHEHTYVTGEALQKLVQNPVPTAADKKWTEEETKKFMKGLKQWGKNFFKIQKELLMHKTTSELVEFYYLWKKTPQAQGSQRPRPRQRRPQNQILRRVRPGNNNKDKTSRPASSEFLDASSASENEFDSEDSESKDLTGYACHHCYSTTSKNWHHAGKDRALLCYDCRMWFKKYGDLRPVDRAKTMPPCLFKPVKCEDSEFDETECAAAVRTRTRSCKDLTLFDKERQSLPVGVIDDVDRKSPGSYSTTSSGSSTAELTEANKHKTPTKNRRKGKRAEKCVSLDGSSSPASKRRRASVSTSEDQEDESTDEKDKVDDVKENIQTSSKVDAYEFREDSDMSEVCATSSYRAQTQGSLLTPDKPPAQIDPPLLTPSALPPPTSASAPLPLLTNPPTPTPTPVPPPRQCTSVIQLNNTVPTSTVHDVPASVKEEVLSDEEGLVMHIGEAPAMKEPDAKVDDTIVAEWKGIFRRHWYRGEDNSCARTDLNYVWDEKRREERRKNHAASLAAKKHPEIKREPTPQKTPTQPSPSMRVPAQCAPQSQPQGGPQPGAAQFAGHAGMQNQPGVPFPMPYHPGAAQALQAHASRLSTQNMTHNQIMNMMHDPMFRAMGDVDRLRLHETLMREQQMEQQLRADNGAAKAMLEQQLRADNEVAQALKAQALAAQAAQPPRPTPSAQQPPQPPSQRPPSSMGQPPPSPFPMDPRNPRAQQFLEMQRLALAGMGGPNLAAEVANWNRMQGQQAFNEQIVQTLMLLEQREQMGDVNARNEKERMLASLMQPSPQHHTHSHTHTHLHLHGTPPVSAAPTTAPAGLAMFGGPSESLASPGGVRFTGPTLPTIPPPPSHANDLMRLSHMHAQAQYPFPGASHLAADQLLRQQHEVQQMQQAMLQSRAQQQHSDMMRRLQREGTVGVFGSFNVMRPQHPS